MPDLLYSIIMNDEALNSFISLEALKQFHQITRHLFGFTLGIADPATHQLHYFGPRENLNPFCLTLQKNPKAARACAECDARHQEKVRESKRPLAYKCHAGLTDFVIPVTLNGELVLFLLCGQVLDAPPAEKEWRKTARALAHYKLPLRQLKKHYFATKVLAPGVREGLSALFELFANYMADAGYKLMLLRRDGKSRALHLATEYLKSHALAPFKLSETAAAACTSTRTLTRLFKQETGMTVLEFVHKLRIERSRELLADQSRKVAAVAFECGFESVQQFNRVFRKLNRCTPREWRRS